MRFCDRIVVREINVPALLCGGRPFWNSSARNRRSRTNANAFWVIFKHYKNFDSGNKSLLIRLTLCIAWRSAILFTKGVRQIRHNVRFKKYCTNFDARRRIQHIRANEALAPSSLVPQIIHSYTKNVFSHS
jgi:hypothetical protein